jgi:hypothetical protein
MTMLPEILNDEFHMNLQLVVRELEVDTILEIGSGSGNGSTTALVNRDLKKPVFCTEPDIDRFIELKDKYLDCPFVYAYRVCAVPLSKWLTKNQVIEFYGSIPTNLNNYHIDTVLSWYNQSVNHANDTSIHQDGINLIKTNHKIDTFGLVLLDGSPFSGSAELDAVYGAKFIALDDINDIKHYHSHFRLKHDNKYAEVFYNPILRNGYSIFERK